MHAPDLMRIPEIIGAFILVVLIVGVRQNKILWNQQRMVFAASFALLPFLVFNQQIVTGRSIQPYHYEVFIANYAVLIGLVMIVKLVQPVIPRRTLLLITSLCLFWGTIEVNVLFLARSNLDVRNDEMVPVLLRLKELAKHDGTWDGLRNNGKTPALVFSPQTKISRLLPTWAPQGSLLAMGSVSFQSVSRADQKNRLYTHLYYCGKNMEDLRALLNDQKDDPYLSSYTKGTLFGAERVLSFLGRDFQPIRQDEIEGEVRAYEAFVDSFSREQVLNRSVTYAVTLVDDKFDFSHIDLWYERDAGERVGVYNLYRLKLRK
jgi:hypothetical protein